MGPPIGRGKTGCASANPRDANLLRAVAGSGTLPVTSAASLVFSVATGGGGVSAGFGLKNLATETTSATREAARASLRTKPTALFLCDGGAVGEVPGCMDLISWRCATASSVDLSTAT